MQKKNQNKTSIIKQIILYTTLVILVLLTLFAEDIIKLASKKQINLAENTENDLISNEPNIPQLSAGMIPIKWDGANWVITTSKDKDWYDYSNGKPAYIMLNDGTYQSELIRDMTGKKLASNVVGNDVHIVPNENDTLGTIFMWIPRFVYKENGEIAYIKEEVTPGVDWIVPDLFMYKIADETKPDFSLSGIWIEKDVDTTYATKIAEMNKEEGTYGFIANTKPKQITSIDINTIQNYINTLTTNIVGNDALAVPTINNITNSNRIILQIVNTSKYEPIKARITYNPENQKIEIRVTYTSNGIREILDENGNNVNFVKQNGIIIIEKENIELDKNIYYFIIVDNKGNKKELTIGSIHIYKVAYINGTDNMDNSETYEKRREKLVNGITDDESTLLNKIGEKNTNTNLIRAMINENSTITAIEEETRTNEDEQFYSYSKYTTKITHYSATKGSYKTVRLDANSDWYGSSKYMLSDKGAWNCVGDTIHINSNPQNCYYTGNTKLNPSFYGMAAGGTPSCWEYVSTTNGYFVFRVYTMNVSYNSNYTGYFRGDFISNIIAKDGTYKHYERNSDTYWYIKGGISPKFTLHKYSSDLNLLSTYDVDTSTLTTVPIDISNKGKNKLKLTLTTTGTDYKIYISNDNATWQEVTDITSGEPKELNVEGWNNLYIKIEINTSIINSIDVAYYKE